MGKSFDEQAQLQERLLFENPKILKVNREAAKRRIAGMVAKGTNPRTITRDIYTLKLFLEALGNKSYSRAKKEDIEQVFAKIERSDYSESTKEKIKASAKTFYRYLKGDDVYYPKQVAWIKVKRRIKPKLPEILNEDEIKRMIESTPNQRDKAIIALLFDAGLRIGELLNLKVKDVELDKEPAHITVDGKTGMRRVPIFFSAPYIAQYINSEKREENEPLFLAIGSWSNMRVPIDRAAVAKMLTQVAKKAKISKRMYPHLFRHSRASYYANKLTEQQLKVFFGWVGDSRMAATYVHLSGRDIDNALLQANGLPVEKEYEKPKLTVKVCAKCKMPNTIDAIHCNRCGATLDVKNAMEAKMGESQLKESLLESIKDPKVIEELVHAYLEDRKKKGKK